MFVTGLACWPRSIIVPFRSVSFFHNILCHSIIVIRIIAEETIITIQYIIRPYRKGNSYNDNKQDNRFSVKMQGNTCVDGLM